MVRCDEFEEVLGALLGLVLHPFFAHKDNNVYLRPRLIFIFFHSIVYLVWRDDIQSLPTILVL